MADYAKARALAKQFIECIGDEDEGANPSIPKQKADINDGGQDSLESLAPAADDSGFAGTKSAGEGDVKKKKKESALAMMGAALASKLGK